MGQTNGHPEKERKKEREKKRERERERESVAMDLLAQYGDDDDDDECGNETKRVGQGSASATFRSTGVVAAPEVSNTPSLPPPLSTFSHHPFHSFAQFLFLHFF